MRLVELFVFDFFCFTIILFGIRDCNFYFKGESHLTKWERSIKTDSKQGRTSPDPKDLDIWRPPSLTELNPNIFNMQSTHFSLKTSIYDNKMYKINY